MKELLQGMGTWSICCGGIGIVSLVFLGMSIWGGLNSRTSNYTEFTMDEYNNPYTWKDKGNYE